MHLFYNHQAVRCLFIIAIDLFNVIVILPTLIYEFDETKDI
jgi:hypothetical protein